MKQEICIVYAYTDEKGNILKVNSDAFISNVEGLTPIDKGIGDQYHHAQGNYFDKPIYTEDGIPRYKLVDGEVQERAEEEIAADRAAIPTPPPTAQEQLRADVDFLAAMQGVTL